MEARLNLKARDLSAEDNNTIKLLVEIPPIPATPGAIASIEVMSVGLTDAAQIKNLLEQIVEMIQPDNFIGEKHVTPEPKARPFNPGAPK